MVNRRHFLAAAATAGACGLTARPLFAAGGKAARRERVLTLYATNTGEMIRLAYWTPTEGYVDDALRELDHLMRDRHTNKIKRIDRRLVDLIHALQLRLQPRQPIHLLSGYRAPETNERLRRAGRGVARDSLHMRGMAADIRMPDRDYDQLHHAALALGGGGVGRYRRSRFVHLDTGPVRRWG